MRILKDYMQTTEFSEMLDETMDTNPEYSRLEEQNNKLYEELEIKAPNEEYQKLIRTFDEDRRAEKCLAYRAAYERGFADGIKMILDALLLGSTGRATQ